jgi:chorismate mutase
MKKAAFDQLSAEGKINTLIGKRQQLMRDIAKVQEGSAQFHEMREQVLGVETEIKGLVNERTEEIRQAAERNVRTPQFTAAVEEGSVEAYRARIGAERKDEVAKNTKLMDDKLKNLVKIGKDNTTLLQEAVAAMTGTVQVVSIV